MKTTGFELRSVINFLLLNASFSSNNGLKSGKLAVVLFLFHAQNNKLIAADAEIPVSYLYEILSEQKLYHTDNYGDGSAGCGIVLEHLRQADFIEYVPDEMLKRFESHIIYYHPNMTEQIDIASGLSGNGLYLCHRLHGLMAEQSSSINRYKEFLQSYMHRIVKSYPYYRSNEYLHQVETNIWNGLTGVLLFLSSARKLDVYDIESEQVATAIMHRLLLDVKDNEFCWSNAEAFVGLFQGHTIGNHSILQDELVELFTLFIDTAHQHLQSVDFHNAAFLAVLIRLLGRKYKCARAIALSDVLCEQVKGKLEEGNMAQLFEYNPAMQTFNMGIYRGLCGTALSVLSVQTEDYSWLEIFGIDIN